MIRIKYLFVLLVIIASTIAGMAQTNKEKIVKELSFPKKSPNNVVQVENIFGSVQVETHNSDKVLFEVERIITSKTANGLKKSEELTLEFALEGDSIVGYFKAPYISRNGSGFNGEIDGFNHTNRSGRRSISNKRMSVNIDRDLGYEFEFNFKVKVPQNTNVAIMTVNNGSLKVSDLTANKILAHNVNGPITLDNVAADIDARTVNGSVKVTYKENPKGAANMETINGNVELLYKKNLSAIINFSSFNGDFYTDLPDLTKLPVVIEKTNNKDGATTQYKVDKTAAYKTGSGNARLDLKTFNGKVIVKAGS